MYGIPSDMPLAMSDSATRETAIGTMRLNRGSFMTGSSRELPKLIANIIGTVPSRKLSMYSAPCSGVPVADEAVPAM